MVRSTEDNEVFAFNRERYGERIRLYRQQKGLTQPQLSQLLGMSRNTVSNWEAGRGRPDINLLPELCSHLGISISQFFGTPGTQRELNLEQQRLLRDFAQLSSANRYILRRSMEAMLHTQQQESLAERIRDIRRVALSSLAASAGTGNYLFEASEVDYAYLHLPQSCQHADEIVTVSGNSMEPTYHNGDQLLVQYAKALSYGEIGVFVVDGEGFVKEYQPDGLHSHNPAYPVRRFDSMQDARVVGRVLGVVTEEMTATPEEIDAFMQQ